MTLRQINLDKINKYNRSEFTKDMEALAEYYCGVHCGRIKNCLNYFNFLFEVDRDITPDVTENKEHTEKFIDILKTLHKKFESITTFLIELLTFNINYVSGVRKLYS